MPSIQDNIATWTGYDWSQAGDEWSRPWGGSHYQWYGLILPRIAGFVPAASVLEIAPGFGRCTQFLLKLSGRYIGVDLTPRCVEACRKRFAEAGHARFFANDGKSLSMVEDDSVDFAFSWDSLVHAERDVVASYLKDLSRKLGKDGVAFIHHSNLGAFVQEGEESPPFPNIHWRDTTMSADTFERICGQVGLRCISQEWVNWGEQQLIDAFSVVTRPGSAFDRPREVFRNTGFASLGGQLCELARLYGVPGSLRR